MKKNKELAFNNSILDQAWFNYWMNQLEESNGKNISQRTLNASLGKSRAYRLRLNADTSSSIIHKLQIL